MAWMIQPKIIKTIWRRLIMIKPPRMIIMKPIKNQNMSCLICMVNDICSPYTFAVSHIAF